MTTHACIHEGMGSEQAKDLQTSQHTQACRLSPLISHSVLVATAMVTLSSAQAPAGSGTSTSPVRVAGRQQQGVAAWWLGSMRPLVQMHGTWECPPAQVRSRSVVALPPRQAHPQQNHA